MIQPLILAVGQSLLIWIGMWMLLNRRYKWSTFILYVVLTSIFVYYNALLIGQWGRATLFLFTFTISSLRKGGWIFEAKTNFFHLAIVHIIMMLGRAWAELIAYWIYGYSELAEFYELPLMLSFTALICVIAFFFVQGALKKSGITDFIGRIDAEYSTLLVVGIGIILLCYYGVILSPLLFDIECAGMIYMNPIYMTMLTFITTGLVLLFSAIIKKEMILIRRNASLANINVQLSYKQEEILQKEALIESLDNKIMNMGNVHKRLRDFEHGQQELLMALGGSIESNDKEIAYELLEEYGVKVQEVLKHGSNFPDANQLITAKLMPVRSLLYSKADDAINESITFTIETPAVIDDIGMPVLDFIDILGVWLTNAIEEAMHAEEKWIHTSFILEKDPNGLNLLEVRVTNSCRKNALNPTLAQGVSTKGEGRGSGLRIVEEMMLKHEHIYVSTKVSDEKFMQLLEIVLDMPEVESEPVVYDEEEC